MSELPMEESDVSPIPESETMPAVSEPPAVLEQEPEPSGLKLKWLLIFAVFQIAAYAIVNGLFEFESLTSFISWYIILPLSVVLFLIWWMFLSGAAWPTRWKGLFAFVLLAGAFVGTVRIEDFEGDMRPQFAWRWSPTSEDKALNLKQEQLQSIGEADSERELVVTEADWPEFRNDDREGVVADVKLNLDFKANPPEEIWRQEVGLGWSSFSIVDDLCFTQEQIFEKEYVNCYELKTGKLVWSYDINERFEEPVGGDGPRATPTIHEGRAYTQGATGVLSCLDAVTGRKIWSRNILEDAGAKNVEWAMSASPLIVGDHVITNPGGENGKGVIAYNKQDGEIVWARGDHPASYAGLRLETLHGQEQLILYDGDGVAGLDPADGTELWRFEWTNQPKVNAAQPIVRDNKVFISSSYNIGSSLLDIGYTEGEWSQSPKWSKTNFFKLKFNDGVYKDGYIYGLDESLMSCIDMEKGRRMWKARSDTGFGQLILLGETLVILTEGGELVFAEANPEKWIELFRMPVLTGKTWNNPAFAHGYLLVRNHKEAVCLKLAVEE